MRMTQIEQVLVIASEGSINKAAQKLFISQPNLSLSLKQLETELGSRIFERTGRGVKLTNFGREFLAYAQPAHRQFKLLGDFCNSLMEQPSLSLSVASQYFRFANTVFINICQKWWNDNFRFSFYEGSFQEVVDSVRSQESEVGLVILSSMQKRIMLHMLKSNGVEYHRLVEESAAVIVGKDHPLCRNGQTRVGVEHLKSYPLAIYRDTSYSMAPEWEMLGMGDNRKRIVVKDRATLNELIATTDAYTVGVHNKHAYSSTRYYTNVRALALSNAQSSLEIGYIINKSRPLSPIAQEYVDAIRLVVQ
jgi:DNA-binding transcriptional LysR family regulator